MRSMPTALVAALDANVVVIAGDDEDAVVTRTLGMLERRGVTVERLEPGDSASIGSAVRSHDAVCNLVPVIDPPAGSIVHALRGGARRRRHLFLASLAEALSAAPETRLVQRSTSALYADGGRHEIREDWPIEPNDATRMALDAERLAHEHRQRGGAAVVLRLADPYGAEDHWSSRLDLLARRGWEPFDGPPDAYFPLVRPDDAAAAFAAALFAPDGLYNVASADVHTNAQLNAIFSQRAGRELQPLYETYRSADRELRDRSCRLDTSTLARATGWRPQPLFEGGLQ